MNSFPLWLVVAFVAGSISFGLVGQEWFGTPSTECSPQLMSTSFIFEITPSAIPSHSTTPTSSGKVSPAIMPSSSVSSHLDQLSVQNETSRLADTYAFMVVHSTENFPIRNCLDSLGVPWLVAVWREKSNLSRVFNAANWTYTQSRNELAYRALLMGWKQKYYVFFDGDNEITCSNLTAFLKKGLERDLNILHPACENWAIPSCNCTWCGLIKTDLGFLSMKRERLHLYLPWVTACDAGSWITHHLHFIHQLRYNGDVAWEDPENRYLNSKHEKVHGYIGWDCIRRYFADNNVPLNEAYLYDPWPEHQTQPQICLN